VQTTAEQQLAQTMPTALQIFPRIITRSRQIPHRLVVQRRRLHGRQQSRTSQLRQLACIAAICFHPLTGLAWNQRQRHDVAAHPRRRHPPLQGIAT